MIRIEEFETSNASQHSGKHSRNPSKASKKRQKFRILVEEGINEDDISDRSLDILQHSGEKEDRMSTRPINYDLPEVNEDLEECSETP